MTGAYAGGAYGSLVYGGALAEDADDSAGETFPTVWVEYSEHGPLEEPAWVALDGCVRSISIVRGRSGETAEWDAGTAEIVLRNDDRQFDPDHATSPIVDYLTTNRRVRVRASWAGTTYPLFDGFADVWEQVPGGPRNNYAECVLRLTDAFKWLARLRLEATDALVLDDINDGYLDEARLAGPYTFGTENAGTRAETIYGASGLPDGMWTVDPMTTTLVADSPDRQSLMVDYLRRIAASVGGHLYVDADGTIRQTDRHAWVTNPTQSTTTGVWTDAGIFLKYQSVDMLARDERTVANIIERGREDDTSARKRDRTSIATYGPNEDVRTDLLTEDDLEIVSQVDWLLTKSTDPRPRVAALTVVPRRDPTYLFPQVLGRELLDRFTLTRRLASTGDTFVSDYWVDSIEHTIAPLEWQTVWSGSLADDPGAFFFLDESVLDSATALLAY